MDRRFHGLAAVSLLMAGCATVVPTEQELYDKAKLEKELVVYGGGPASLYEVPARASSRNIPASR